MAKKIYTGRFEIPGKVAVVTGGGGLIGMKHCEAIVEGAAWRCSWISYRKGWSA